MNNFSLGEHELALVVGVYSFHLVNLHCVLDVSGKGMGKRKTSNAVLTFFFFFCNDLNAHANFFRKSFNSQNIYLCHGKLNKKWSICINNCYIEMSM